MLRDGGWLVPTIGGDPWLERPPVPMWFICGVYSIAGDSASDSVARLAAILVAIPIVLLVAGIGSRLYGRGTGLAAGLIFATIHEVFSYSSNPEADIFLALIVTAVLAVFVRLELGEADPTPNPLPKGRGGLLPSPLREGGWGVSLWNPLASSPPARFWLCLLRASRRDQPRQGR